MGKTAIPAPLVFEHNGMLWKPLPGCASTFDDLVCAQARWLEIFHETHWSPWRAEELAAEQERAHDVMQEWARAEPNHRYLTNRELGAQMGAITRKHRARFKADQARWERDKERYVPEREKARFALLELESVRARQTRELGRCRSGERYPAMVPERRAEMVADLVRKLDVTENEIARLAEIVGDPEEVLDAAGQLPRDRRSGNLIMYDIRRRDQVPRLMQSTAELPQRIRATKDRRERAKLEAHLQSERRQLRALMEVPILSAGDMCADCYVPQFQHEPDSGTDGTCPCPSWPRYTARMEQVWNTLRAVQERQTPPAPEPAKPRPLTTIPGNIPISDVIARLSILQQEHPKAVVRRGRANRWELWPESE